MGLLELIVIPLMLAPIYWKLQKMQNIELKYIKKEIGEISSKMNKIKERQIAHLTWHTSRGNGIAERKFSAVIEDSKEANARVG